MLELGGHRAATTGVSEHRYSPRSWSAHPGCGSTSGGYAWTRSSLTRVLSWGSTASAEHGRATVFPTYRQQVVLLARTVQIPPAEGHGAEIALDRLEEGPGGL